MKIVYLPAGRYFVGDVGGVSRPFVAIPARSSVFYDDSGAVEIEIAGGGSSIPDENAFSVFGVCEFEKMADFFDEFEDGSFGCFEITKNTEVVYDFDYLEIVGVMKFSFARECGLKFTDTEDAFELAFS